VNASTRDLVQVCSSIRGKKALWAVAYLEKAAEGEVAVLYRTHNSKLGHRRELGGRKGRYPEKAARFVLKALKSAMANAKVKGLGEDLTVAFAAANTKDIYPRLASKGRRARSNLVTSRIEIIVKGTGVPKGVSVTPPKKADAPKVAGKPKAAQMPATKEAVRPEVKVVPPRDSLKDESIATHEHKHETEKHSDDGRDNRPAIPHQHGEKTK